MKAVAKMIETVEACRTCWKRSWEVQRLLQEFRRERDSRRVRTERRNGKQSRLGSLWRESRVLPSAEKKGKRGNESKRSSEV